MTTTTPTEPHPRLTLLTLPLDIQKEIIDHLVHYGHPTLAILRRTHSSFLAVIPKSDLRSKPTKAKLRHQLINAYYCFNYLLPEGHVPCSKCMKVVPREGPDDRQLRASSKRSNGELRWKKVWVYTCGNCKPKEADTPFVVLRDGRVE